MPKLSKIRIWGKFFALQTQLRFAEAEGYSSDTSEYWRIDPFQFYSQLKRASNDPAGLAVFLEQRHNALSHIIEPAVFSDTKLSNPVPPLNKATGSSLHFWELNFSGFSEFAAARIRQQKFSYVDVANDKEVESLARHLHFDKDLVINALFRRPVIPHSYPENELTLRLFEKLDNNFLSLPAGTDLLIITGEMVWSGWLNLYMLLRKVHQLARHDVQIVIDEQGLWQAFLRGHAGESELYKLDREAFTPQITYLKDPKLLKVSRGEVQLVVSKKEVDRKLILTKDRCGLFDLGESGFELTNEQRLGRMVFLDVFAFRELEQMSQNEFNHWWKTTLYPVVAGKRYLHLQQEELPILVGNISVSFGDRFEVKNTAESGSLIKQGELIGSKQTTKMRVVDCWPYTHELAKYMAAADGEIVKEGSVIAKIPAAAGLLEKIITSPQTGKISYEAITDSLIIIRQELPSISVEAFHNGVIIQVLHNQGYIINTDYYAVPVSLSTPGEFQGILVKPEYEPVAYPKIVLLKDLVKLPFSLEQIIADRIVCLIAPFSNYDVYLAFLKRYQRHLKYTGLVIIEEFGIAPAVEISTVVNKAIGKFINIGEHQLKLPLGSFAEKIKYYNADVIASSAGLEQAKSPQIGDKIRLISYFRTVPYARIEKVNFSSNQVLINTSHTIEEGYLDNIILY